MDRYATLRGGLVAAWCPSLKAGGYVLQDFAGRYNASITDAVWRAMAGGVVLEFNGTSAVASNETAQIALNGATAATHSLWMWKSAANATAASGFSSTSGSGADNNRFSAIWFSDGNVYCTCESSQAQAFASVAQNTAGWIHLAIVFDGSQPTNAGRLKVFVNGQSRTASYSGTIASALSASLGSYTLGKDSSNRFGSGRLDDVRLYRRVLTHQEIITLSSRRGIGLLPTRNRRGKVLGSQFWLRQSGEWKKATSWVNAGGTWKQATPKLNVGGTWR